MRRVLIATGSIVFLDTMLFGAIIPLLPDFADTYDLTKLEAGALLGAYGAGALVGGIPGGLLVGRIGPKRGLLLGLSVLCALEPRVRAGRTARSLSARARFVQGLSSATTWSAALAWVAVSTPRERRGQALGTVFGVAVLGFVVGPMFGGVARPRRDPLVVRRRRRRRRSPRARGRAVRADRPRRSASPGRSAGRIRDRAFVGGLWLNTLPALFFGVLDVLVPLRLDDAGYGAIAIAAVFVVAGLIEVVLNPLVGRVSDRRGRLLPVRVSLSATIAVACALAFATEPLVVAALVVAALDQLRRLLHAGDGAGRRPVRARGASPGHRLRRDEQRVGGGRAHRPGRGRRARARPSATRFPTCSAVRSAGSRCWPRPAAWRACDRPDRAGIARAPTPRRAAAGGSRAR